MQGSNIDRAVQTLLITIHKLCDEHLYNLENALDKDEVIYTLIESYKSNNQAMVSFLSHHTIKYVLELALAKSEIEQADIVNKLINCDLFLKMNYSAQPGAAKQLLTIINAHDNANSGLHTEMTAILA